MRNMMPAINVHTVHTNRCGVHHECEEAKSCEGEKDSVQFFEAAALETPYPVITDKTSSEHGHPLHKSRSGCGSYNGFNELQPIGRAHTRNGVPPWSGNKRRIRSPGVDLPLRLRVRE